MEDKQKNLRLYNATREGFRTWCLSQDLRSYKLRKREWRLFDDEMWSIAKLVPCHAEFIRWVWWHNHAIDLIKRNGLPVHTMFYEDYEERWESTVDQLFHFLVLSPAVGASPLPFQKGKHYIEYFTAADMLNARRLVKILASPTTWDHIYRYFSA